MDDLGYRVVEAFRSLPQRYLGAPPGFDATYCIRLADIGRSWEVRCTPHGARARAPRHRAAVCHPLSPPPRAPPPLLRIHDVPVGKLKISTLTMGEGPDLLLLHGLGSTKASFFETAAALSRAYRVHALALRGFGGSSKPARAPHGAPSAARAVL